MISKPDKSWLGFFNINVIVALILFTIWPAFVYLVDFKIGIKEIIIDFKIVSIFGMALGILLGFKNGSAYSRWWEARQIWGGIINISRTFANNVLFQTTSTDQEKKEVVYRHLAWVYGLKNTLREIDPHNEINSFLLIQQDKTTVKSFVNIPTGILTQQSKALSKLKSDNKMTGKVHEILLSNHELMFALQGKCERIKKTPLPKPYKYFTSLFMYAFLFFLPMAMIEKQGLWLTPFMFLISMVFFMVDFIGNQMEKPFDNEPTDVPMTNMCQTIEMDLRQMLGEEDYNKPEGEISGITW